MGRHGLRERYCPGSTQKSDPSDNNGDCGVHRRTATIKEAEIFALGTKDN